VEKPKKSKRKDKKGKGKVAETVEEPGSDLEIDAEMGDAVAADLDEYYNMDYEDMVRTV
jgi:hypothetical protein